ncbi:MAG TPA: hypothetical protein VGI77_01475 [Gaiellaceae bacterium]
MRPLILATCFAALAAASLSAGGSARSAATVKKCAQLELKSPALHHSLRAATIFCLRPSSIRVSASYAWSTCPGTPTEEACQEGTNQLIFQSTSANPNLMDSWGGENFPGAGLFSLPGMGTFNCESHSVDRQHGHIEYAKHTKSVAVRDQAASYAATGSGIRVGTSLHPGMRGPFGANASVHLGQPNTCGFAGLPVTPDAARSYWPGKVVPVASLWGAAPVVRSTGKLTKSVPLPASLGYAPNAKLVGTIHWSLRVASSSALTR